MEVLHRKKDSIATKAILASVIVVFILPARAQTPNIGGAIEQAAPPRMEQPTSPPEETPVIVEKEEETFSLPDGGTQLIKVFRIENAEEGDWPRLQELLAPNRFKKMTMADIVEAANQVTVYYRDKGYLLAKAYVPPQDATNGVLTIRVLFGAYGKISVKNASAIRNSFLRSVFEKPGKASPVVYRDSLERAMLIVRDMPGGRIPKISITSGEKPGTSDFLVEMDGSPRVGGYAMANNQGSKFTGEHRMYGAADMYSLLGVADRLSVSYMTTDTADLKSFRLAYDFPLAHNGLRAEISASRTTYELGGVYSDLGMTGSAYIVEGKIVYPVRKCRDETMDLTFGLAHKRMSDDISLGNMENPRNATVFAFSLDREASGSIGNHRLFTKIGGGFNVGDLNITDKVQAAVDAAGPNTAGAFSKFNLDLAATLELTEKLSLKGAARVQKIFSGKNVDSTEQFFLSGPGGVRAWTESVGFDNGCLFGGEVRYALPEAKGIRHAMGFFVDSGRAWAEKGNYTLTDEFTLTDAGPGYSISFLKFFGSVHIAIPIGDARGVGDPGTRVLWQAGIAF